MKPDQVMAAMRRPMTMAVTRFYQRRVLFLPLVMIVFLTLMWYTSDTIRTETEILICDKSPLLWEPSPPHYYEADPECIDQPGASRAIVVLKTGASEIDSRLPIHFQTTLKCTPNFVIFSDLNQTFHGHQIHDLLEELHLYVDSRSEELDYYNTLRERQREGKNMTGLATEKPATSTDWFIFTDADTSILFSSILKYLSSLNPEVPLYMGSTAVIADFPFAHGGSGYVVSAGAAKALAEETEEQADKHYRAATDICCGDGNLAHALDDLGVKVSRIYPSFNGETPRGFHHEEWTWCFEALSFHHMPAEDVEQMWLFEREMMLNDTIPTYADVFTHFSAHLNDILDKYDNLSQDEKMTESTIFTLSITYSNSSLSTVSGCYSACAQHKWCMQYRFKQGECTLQRSIRVGHKNEDEGYTSGRMTDRLQEWKDKARVDGPGTCNGLKAKWKIPETKLGPLWIEGGRERGKGERGDWVD